MVAMGVDESVKGAARCNEIAKELREAKLAEFDILCKQWEQAS